MRTLIALLLTLLTFSVHGAVQVISFIDHPTAQAMKPVVAKAYASIGMSVRFVEMPMARRLLALQNGTTDGDVIARDNLPEEYDQVLRVGPPLTKVNLELICPADKICDMRVFKQAEIRIVLDRSCATLLQKVFSIPLAANIKFIESPRTRSNLFTHHRIDYFIRLVGDGFKQHPINRAHQQYSVGSHHFYHYIHKRHSDIAVPLAIALEQSITTPMPVR